VGWGRQDGGIVDRVSFAFSSPFFVLGHVIISSKAFFFFESALSIRNSYEMCTIKECVVVLLLAEWWERMCTIKSVEGYVLVSAE